MISSAARKDHHDDIAKADCQTGGWHDCDYCHQGFPKFLQKVKVDQRFLLRLFRCGLLDRSFRFHRFSFRLLRSCRSAGQDRISVCHFSVTALHRIQIRSAGNHNRCNGLDLFFLQCIKIDFRKKITCFHLISDPDLRCKDRALEMHGFESAVNQQFNPIRRLNPVGMKTVMDHDDFTVNRAVQLSFTRNHCNAVSHHFLRKYLIRHFFQRHRFSAQW